MEIFILLCLLLLFIYWVLNLDKEDKNVGNKSNFPKYKLDKKQSEENSKKYKIWKEVQESKFVKSNTPDPYYESEEYKEFLKGVNKKYDELVAKGEIRKFNPQEQVFYGERGGRYRIRYNKNGEEYRDYF
tara:strand:- start:41 stop:430 length:390 start_codon:yes stop_codon:yes gene_type:complete